ncbi:hypothetical protein [Lapillicoccus sp.]|uniref:hypothetical protein n=1 Tax=Lapillicoccus sp. TaxID=1909287 RepID=UPI003983356A
MSADPRPTPPVALARSAAAETGYGTYFTTAADRAARCHRAAIEGHWATNCASAPDPPAWPSTNRAACRCPPRPPPPLFQVVSQRYLKTSKILTSNRGVG